MWAYAMCVVATTVEPLSNEIYWNSMKQLERIFKDDELMARHLNDKDESFADVDRSAFCSRTTPRRVLLQGNIHKHP